MKQLPPTPCTPQELDRLVSRYRRLEATDPAGLAKYIGTLSNTLTGSDFRTILNRTR
jgi:hypothetical protein